MTAGDWVVEHARSIASAGVVVAVVLALAYPPLLYLDRTAGFEAHGFPGVSELVQLATGLFIARHPRIPTGWMLPLIELAGQVNSDVPALLGAR